MKKYYVHKDNEQLGPLSIDELKDLKITRQTMIWFEGADNWTKAEEVADLDPIFKSLPPPLITPPLMNKTSVEQNIITSDKSAALLTESPNQNNSKKIKTIIIVVFSMVLLISVGTIIYSKQQAKQKEIQNQIDEQNTKLEEQNAKIKQQEAIEDSRKEEELRQQNEAKKAKKAEDLAALQYQYDEALTSLRAAKINLEEIQKFQLLRSSATKEQQVQTQLETIRSWENEVDRLKVEISKYK